MNFFLHKIVNILYLVPYVLTLLYIHNMKHSVAFNNFIKQSYIINNNNNNNNNNNVIHGPPGH